MSSYLLAHFSHKNFETYQLYGFYFFLSPAGVTIYLRLTKKITITSFTRIFLTKRRFARFSDFWEKWDFWDVSRNARTSCAEGRKENIPKQIEPFGLLLRRCAPLTIGFYLGSVIHWVEKPFFSPLYFLGFHSDSFCKIEIHCGCFLLFSRLCHSLHHFRCAELLQDVHQCAIFGFGFYSF